MSWPQFTINYSHRKNTGTYIYTDINKMIKSLNGIEEKAIAHSKILTNKYIRTKE